MHDLRGIQNPWRCHWSDEVQKKRRFSPGKTCSRDFGAPACHPSTLIDFVNTALASKGSLETICMICEGCRTHRAVTGPMNRRFFFRKVVLPGFWGPWMQSEHLMDFANAALSSKDPVEPIYMILEG